MNESNSLNENLLDDWLEIGTIVSPQGLKGELRIYPNSDFPERFTQPGQRWLLPPNSQQLQEVELVTGRYIPGKNLYVVRLAGVENREGADALRGCRLLVSKADRPQLQEDEYHVSDLVDLEVYNQLTQENIGVVTDIFWAGNDLLEVTLHQQPAIKEAPTDLEETPRKKRRSKQKLPATILIPFVKDIVPVVDIEGKRVEITPPPGLLEVNEK